MDGQYLFLLTLSPAMLRCSAVAGWWRVVFQSNGQQRPFAPPQDQAITAPFRRHSLCHLHRVILRMQRDSRRT